MRRLLYLSISILVYASVQGAKFNKQHVVANDTIPQPKVKNQNEPQMNVHYNSKTANESNPINSDHIDNGNNTIYNSDIKWNKGDATLDSSSSPIENKPEKWKQSPKGKDSKKELPIYPENTQKLMKSKQESRLKRDVENNDEKTIEIESGEFENILPLDSNIAKVNDEVAKSDACVDRDSNVCPILAHYGECDDNEEIRKNCKKSCKLCGNSNAYYVPKVNDKVTKPDVCFDVDDHLCPRFAENGECDRNENIRNNCKFSCKVCGNGIDGNCKDQYKSCSTWASDGLCSEYSEFMFDNCKKSCKLCKSYSPVKLIQEIPFAESNVVKINEENAKTDACADADDHFCPVFAKHGECARNAKIRNNCKFSCKVCDENCEDQQKSCSTWASDGLCSEYPEFMFDNCKKSCKICKSYSPVKQIQEISLVENNIAKMNEEVVKTDANCRDQYRFCQSMAEKGKCSSYSEFMTKSCKKSCNLCESYSPEIVKTDCRDQYRFCQSMAEKGKCSSYSEFMTKSCKKSCNLCKSYSPVEVVDSMFESIE